jgi:hypothetical protein
LAARVNADGDYVIGVTTYPDFEFEGATETGRYVLSVQAIDGIVIGPGDDGSVNVPLGFSFPYQGQMWDNVFVNGNGNLTFGAPNGDFSESVLEFLGGPPRIAPLWDDLNSAFGLVVVTPEADALTVHYVSVPEFLSDRANNFSVRLESSGKVTLAYLGILAADGLVGITQGNGALNPGPTDLSRSGALSKVGTTYELFPSAGAPFDMPFRRLFFR